MNEWKGGVTEWLDGWMDAGFLEWDGMRLHFITSWKPTQQQKQQTLEKISKVHSKLQLLGNLAQRLANL